MPAGSRAACASCHAEIVREREASPHRRAYSNRWFQAGYSVDHRAFCRDCHAPLHEGSDPAPGSLAFDEGIGCAGCHERAGEHPSAEPRADFNDRVCADCHQFRFPEARMAVQFDPHEWMQRTEAEWRESGVAQTCTECHMAPNGSRREHTFAVLAEPRLLAAAVAIEGASEWRGDSTEVSVSLTARGAGHAVPTGDVFRALELSVWIDGAEPQRRLLMRRFGTMLGFDPAAGFSGTLGEVEDSRVPARGARTERFLFEGRAEVVHYRLDYLRANPAQAAAQGLSPIDNRIPLLEGLIVRGTERAPPDARAPQRPGQDRPLSAPSAIEATRQSPNPPSPAGA